MAIEMVYLPLMARTDNRQDMQIAAKTQAALVGDQAAVKAQLNALIEDGYEVIDSTQLETRTCTYLVQVLHKSDAAMKAEEKRKHPIYENAH